MSKKETKAVKTKKKQTGFDIMYRVVTAVLAVAVFPIVYFMNLIYYALDWTNAISLINNFKDIINSDSLLEGLKNFFLPSSGSSATEQVTEISDGYICLAKLDEFKSLINMAGGDGGNFKDMLTNASLRPVVVSLAFFAVMIVLALVILIVCAFKNKPKLIAILSGIGVVFGCVSNVIFSVLFANPLVNGDKTLGDIVGSNSIILQMLGNVIELRYDNAFFVAVGLMVAIFIWSLSVIIVNADDKTEKALREAKKAEKKAKKAKKAAKKAEKTAKKAAEVLKEEQKKETEEKAE